VSLSTGVGYELNLLCEFFNCFGQPHGLFYCWECLYSVGHLHFSYQNGAAVASLTTDGNLYLIGSNFTQVGPLRDSASTAPPVLERVMALQPVRKRGEGDQVALRGLETAFPELWLTRNDTNEKMVASLQLSVVAIQAIQEQQALLRTLDARLAERQAQIEQQDALIATLEAQLQSIA
jgi:hypothetical protein